jgi:hypothetical protein
MRYIDLQSRLLEPVFVWLAVQERFVHFFIGRLYILNRRDSHVGNQVAATQKRCDCPLERTPILG